jgi:hypothetical protein
VQLGDQLDRGDRYDAYNVAYAASGEIGITFWELEWKPPICFWASGAENSEEDRANNMIGSYRAI